MLHLIYHAPWLIAGGFRENVPRKNSVNVGTSKCPPTVCYHQRKFSGKLPIYELLGSLTGIVVLAVVVVAVVVIVVVVVLVVVVLVAVVPVLVVLVVVVVVQHLVKFMCHFSWQVQHLVKF